MRLGAQGYVAKAGGFEPLYRHVEPYLKTPKPLSYT
jgi:hypothetical protein